MAPSVPVDQIPCSQAMQSLPHPCRGHKPCKSKTVQPQLSKTQRSEVSSTRLWPPLFLNCMENLLDSPPPAHRVKHDCVAVASGIWWAHYFPGGGGGGCQGLLRAGALNLGQNLGKKPAFLLGLWILRVRYVIPSFNATFSSSPETTDSCFEHIAPQVCCGCFLPIELRWAPNKPSLFSPECGLASCNHCYDLSGQMCAVGRWPCLNPPKSSELLQYVIPSTWLPLSYRAWDLLGASNILLLGFGMAVPLPQGFWPAWTDPLLLSFGLAPLFWWQ